MSIPLILFYQLVHRVSVGLSFCLFTPSRSPSGGLMVRWYMTSDVVLPGGYSSTSLTNFYLNVNFETRY